MKEEKRCTNCGYYPFCNKTNGPTDKCNEWKEREVQMHLKSKNGEVFDFRKV